jgi:ubiquinone/menaquinone biosynthesis C-methylase UbiE
MMCSLSDWVCAHVAGGSFIHWKLWSWLHSHVIGCLQHLPLLVASTVASWRAGPDVVSSSDSYALRFRGAIGAWQLGVQNRVLMRLLDKKTCHTVLDVGGGHGQYTDDLIGRGHHLTVLGSAPETVHRIRRQVEAGACRFETGDFMQLPYGDREFDCVVSIRQLAHVDDPAGFLAELCRVARHAVIVDFPSRFSFNALSGLLFPLKLLLENKSTRPYTVFPESRLEAILSAQGFRVTGRCPQFCTPMVFHRVVRWVALIRGIEQLCSRLGLTRWFGSPILLRAERRGGEVDAGQAT